jgi:hypothetical protein
MSSFHPAEGPCIAIHRREIVRAFEDDRNWFEKNSERRFRLRKLIPYEFNAPISPLSDGWTWRVLVDRNLAGTCVRIPVWVPVLLPNEGAEDEHLAVIFRQLSLKTVDRAVAVTESLNHLT